MVKVIVNLIGDIFKVVCGYLVVEEGLCYFVFILFVVEDKWNDVFSVVNIVSVVSF